MPATLKIGLPVISIYCLTYWTVRMMNREEKVVIHHRKNFKRYPYSKSLVVRVDQDQGGQFVLIFYIVYKRCVPEALHNYLLLNETQMGKT